MFTFIYFLQVGVGIKPNTNVSAVEEYIDMADVVLIMTVEPGFGGQKFMSDMMTKVQWLRSNYPSLDIEVDGGVGLDTIHQCAEVNEIYQNCFVITFITNVFITIRIFVGRCEYDRIWDCNNGIKKSEISDSKITRSCPECYRKIFRIIYSSHITR